MNITSAVNSPLADEKHSLGEWNSPLSKGTLLKLICLSIRRMRIVDLGWVNTHTYNFFASEWKFTRYFCSMQKGLTLISPFSSFSISGFQRYSQSKSKVVLNRTKFWTFFAFPNFKGAVPPISCTTVITPTQRHVTWQSFMELFPLRPRL